MKRYRASEAPLAMVCPASVNGPEDEIRIESSNPAGLIGTAVHAIIERLIDNLVLPEYWDKIAASIHDFSPNEYQEIKQLAFGAKKFLLEYNMEGTIDTEVELTYEQISGHLDVLVLPIEDGHPVFIIDWKTTRLDIDYSAQMLFYAWLVRCKYPDVKRIRTAVVYLRDQTVDVKEYTADDIALFAKRYAKEVMNWDGRTYRPGGHCAYCPRWLACPAQKKMIEETSTALTYRNPNFLVKADEMIDFYERVGAVERRIAQFREHVKARIQAEGPIQGKDKSLELVTQSRDTIDARKAWPLMESHLLDEEIAQCVSIKKGELLRQIGDSSCAPGTNKGHKKKLFMQALDEAGAVTTKEYETLRLKQSKEVKDGE